MQEILTDFSGTYIDLPVEGQTLRLHAGRFAEWTEEKTIFIADAHLGKIAHFRRAGFNLPGDAGDDTFDRLGRILSNFRPRRLIFLGDLFHSDFNDDFPRFTAWRQQFPATEIWLIPGNHDRAALHFLNSSGIRIENPQMLGPFYLRHEPGPDQLGFQLCGHVHPAVSLSGKGRQRLKVPAFWHKPDFLCLPAFGTFTGTAAVSFDRHDVFFAVTEEKLHKVPAHILPV